MTKELQKTYQDFIIDRIESALIELNDNPAYMARCCQQNESGAVVDRLLHKLKKNERITIRRHYEGETVKESFELDAAYIQGMRDCIGILSFLDAFHTDVHFCE